MSITIHGEEKLIRKLRRMASGQAYRAGVAEAATYVKGQAASYPPVRRQTQPFKTDKQRRYMWWAIRSGAITIPYPRKGAGGGLAGGWTVVFTDGGMNAFVVNAVSYGQWVMGTQMQSQYHAGNWKTERQIAEDAESVVLDILKKHTRMELDRS